jgi:hypothetical protein
MPLKWNPRSSLADRVRLDGSASLTGRREERLLDQMGFPL